MNFFSWCKGLKAFYNEFSRCWQVAGIFHDASIGNAIHVILVRLILLHGEEVLFIWMKSLRNLNVLL